MLNNLWLTRRHFIAALAASVVAANAPLPTGFPTELKPLPPGTYNGKIVAIQETVDGYTYILDWEFFAPPGHKEKSLQRIRL